MADETNDERLGVRDLARRGELAGVFAAAPAQRRRRLRAQAYETLHPVVFGYLTRPIEVRRGHRTCTVSLHALRPDCLDRFHDDMDAVLDDLFRNARMPILNLEGWARRRLVAVTVDAHRRRRGERGALQRPRVPGWLARELGHDDRLTALAIEMLEWVGVEATAGDHDWPVEAWAARRAVAGGDYECAHRSVVADIATVVAAMRTRAGWYANYVERPLGRKRPPLAAVHREGQPAPEPASARLAAENAADDARRAELAALAVTVIADRLAAGEDLRSTVVDVLSAVFGTGTGSDSLDRLPGHDCADDERVSVRLADPRSVDRIVAAVLALLSR